MEVIKTPQALREQLSDWRGAGDHVALVPTMGNLHDGHVSLVNLAREHAERVIVSIFVNPTQFGEGDDYEGYPRTLERDKRRLVKAKAHLIFAPDVETMYPYGTDNATSVTVPVLTKDLCGSFRPGHFDGVTTVVNRLFGLVQPDVAVFGEKDYQQQLIVRRMTADLNLPIRIITGPTMRDEDGLAKSSRNSYLTKEERVIAPQLFGAIEEIGRDLASGQRKFADMEAAALQKLKDAGFRPEYVSIRRAENLDEPNRDCDELVVLVSAWLGKARLIDNLVVHI